MLHKGSTKRDFFREQRTNVFMAVFQRREGKDLFGEYTEKEKKYMEALEKAEAEENDRCPRLGHITFTPDGKFLAVGHRDGTMAFWKPPNQ